MRRTIDVVEEKGLYLRIPDKPGNNSMRQTNTRGRKKGAYEIDS